MKKTNLLLILILAISSVAIKADAQAISIGVSIRVGPPVIPVYVQPACPTDGYLWVPGYWSYGDDARTPSIKIDDECRATAKLAGQRHVGWPVWLPEGRA